MPSRRATEFSPTFAVQGGGFGSQERQTPRQGKGQNSPASAHEGWTPRRLLVLFCSARGDASACEGRAPSVRDRILPLFCIVGGRLQRPKPRRLLGARDTILPLFSVNGGRLWLTRRRRLLSMLLPLFCSARGEALTRERAPSQRACGHQETTIKMGKQQSKWTFLALQYLGLGAKTLGRLLSARAITRRHQGKAKVQGRTRTQQSPMVFFVVMSMSGVEQQESSLSREIR